LAPPESACEPVIKEKKVRKNKKVA
jgi:hypothetical protein